MSSDQSNPRTGAMRDCTAFQPSARPSVGVTGNVGCLFLVHVLSCYSDPPKLAKSLSESGVEVTSFLQSLNRFAATRWSPVSMMHSVTQGGCLTSSMPSCHRNIYEIPRISMVVLGLYLVPSSHHCSQVISNTDVCGRISKQPLMILQRKVCSGREAMGWFTKVFSKMENR